MNTLGADVEVFLRDGERYKSAVGLIGGSKEKPLLVDNGNLQEDNVMAEFAIDPADNVDDWKNNIFNVLNQLSSAVSHHSLHFDVVSSVKFPKSELNTKQARVFGCDPDYNAYKAAPNPAPNPRSVGNLRTAGGHIHMGIPNDYINPMDMMELAKYMDVFLGLPSVLADEDQQRRSMYGMAGSFRPKPYGLEYRTLSNFWIKTEGLAEWAYYASQSAWCAFMNDEQYNFEEVETIINNSDVGGAKKVMEQHGIKEAA